MALALAVHLGTASEASADEAALDEPIAPALQRDDALLNQPLRESDPLSLRYSPGLLDAIESAGRAEEAREYEPVMGARLTERANDGCGGKCEREPKGRHPLAGGLFQGLGALQALGAFVLPERPALTIASSEVGTASLALTIMPTKITRGSGLVAMGKF